MTARRGGLGRGLGALIPSVVLEPGTVADDPWAGPDTGADSGPDSGPGTGERVVLSAAPAPRRAPQGDLARPPGVVLRELPVDEVRPNPRQPRAVFDDDALAELVASIREVGVLQPVVVRPAADGFELVMGERRWRACRAAGLATVPAIVRDTADAAMLRDALLENIHREQLNPLEEAAAYQQLLEEFEVTHDELARRVGRSRSQVSNTIRLLGLPPAVQRRVAAGVLSAGHARALLAVADAARQEELAGRIVAEGLSVRAVEELAALGAPERSRRRAAGPRERDPELERVAAALSERLETRVRVDLGRSHGAITVEFAGTEDLERLLAVLLPAYG